MRSTNQDCNVVMSIMRAIDPENKDYSKLFLTKNFESLFEGETYFGPIKQFFFYYISVAGHFSIQTSLEQICNLTILVTRWCRNTTKKFSGSVRNDIINLHFGSSAGPSVSIPAFCKIPATVIGSIRPNNQPGKRKEPKNEIKLPANRIILPWPIYTEPGAKRGNLGSWP